MRLFIFEKKHQELIYLKMATLHIKKTHEKFIYLNLATLHNLKQTHVKYHKSLGTPLARRSALASLPLMASGADSPPAAEQPWREPGPHPRAAKGPNMKV